MAGGHLVPEGHGHPRAHPPQTLEGAILKVPKPAFLGLRIIIKRPIQKLASHFHVFCRDPDLGMADEMIHTAYGAYPKKMLDLVVFAEHRDSRVKQ